MIWYNENDRQKNKGLSIARSYHNDLYKKRLRQIITLLEIIPDVKVKSFIDTQKKCVLQSVIVEENTWKDFLNDFQADCLKTLEYINKRQTLQFVGRTPPLIWDLNTKDLYISRIFCDF